MTVVSSLQVPGFSACIGAAAGHQHTNLIKREPLVLCLLYESHSLYRIGSEYPKATFRARRTGQQLSPLIVANRIHADASVPCYLTDAQP